LQVQCHCWWFLQKRTDSTSLQGAPEFQMATSQGLHLDNKGTPYLCRIRIRYGDAGDTLRMRIRGVSASPRANWPGNWLSGTFRRVGYGPYPSHPLDSPMPYRIERAATPSVRTHEGDAAGGGWLPAGDEPAGDEPPATRHNPSRSSSPGEAATSSRTGGRRPSPQREGSWRPAPICKVRTP